MSNSPTAATAGQFAPVSAGATPQRVTANEIDVDLQNLEPTEQEIVEADEFIIYGKANIEQWNRPGPGEDDLYIEMEAFEGNIDQLLALENISIGHNDVRIGEPLESHTLDNDATVHIDAGETLDLDAGAELRTGVIREGEQRPDGKPAKEDALWLVANLFGRDDPRGSRFSQKARLGAYYGELDGFSVTVDKKDMTVSSEGTRVHDVDFLAVTVGDDEMIKNPGSSFGVAEFQALFGSDSVADDPDGEGEAMDLTRMTEQFMSGILQRVLGQSRDALATQAIQHAYDEGTDLETAVEQAAGDDNKDAVMQAAEDLDEQLAAEAETLVDEAEDAEAIEDSAAELADEIGVDKEVVMAAIEEIQDMQESEAGEGPPEDGEDEEGDHGEDGEGDDSVEQQQEVVEALAEADPEAVEQALDEVGINIDGDSLSEDHVEQMIDDRISGLQETIEEQLDGLSDEVADTLTQQMATGETPGPAGGGVDSTDLEQQIDEMAEDYGVEMED